MSDTVFGTKYTLVNLNKSNAHDRERKMSKNVSMENKANEKLKC